MWTRRNLSSFTGRQLVADTHTRLSGGCENDASTLENLAEIDARKFYLEAGYSSMFAFCTGELEMEESSASKCIHALRAARKFPAIYEAVANRHLHLSVVCLLAPHLTAENADELLTAAAHQTCVAVKQLLANRFPRPDVPTSIVPLDVTTSYREHDLNHVSLTTPERVEAPRTVIAPLAPGRDELHGTMSQKMSANLRYAQSLSGHSADSRDPMAVLDRALECYVAKLEQQRLGAASRTRPRKSHANGRYVPAQVRREVWERDGGRCTFVGDTGHRCEAHDRLEFDHIVSRARGGATSTENLRLRCRQHNQYEAERTFGAGFMQEKREAARARAVEAKKHRAAAREEKDRAAAEASRNDDVIPYLRALRVPPDRARAAAAQCDAVAGEPIERRVRHALSTLMPRGTTKISFTHASAG